LFCFHKRVVGQAPTTGGEARALRGIAAAIAIARWSV